MVIDQEIQKELDRIIRREDLTACFQPIVLLNKQSIFGYEGLIRGPADSPLHRPESLFDAAQQCGRLVEVDILCRKTIIKQFGSLNLSGVLFVNVNPAILQQRDYLAGVTSQFLRENHLSPNRIVIEITETYPIEDLSLMHAAVRHYRTMGFAVALDDLGAGYSGLKLWSEMKPDYVKIDLHFIQGVDRDPTKQQFIQSILQIAKSLGCLTITEGIETKAEYSTLRKLGAELAQGYYFARPQSVPTAFADSSLFRNEKSRTSRGRDLTAESVLKQCPAVSPATPVATVMELFDRAPHLASIAVVEGDRALGLAARADIARLCTTLHARRKHGAKPVLRFTRENVFQAEKTTPVGNVCKLLADAAPFDGTEIIVLDQGRFAGTASLIDLLHKVTAEHPEPARHINPLTQLPGYVPFQQTLDQWLEGKEDFTLCHLEVDNLRVFNDVYGYERGDEVLIAVADLLRKSVCAGKDFVAHTGGDEFAILFKSTDWSARCRSLLDNFKASTAHYYGLDKPAGNLRLETIDRQGEKLSFSVMTLSVGAVTVNPRSEPIAKNALLERAARAKANARKLFGNALHIETPTAVAPTEQKYQYLH